MKLRKMLGSVDDDSCIKLMKLIETQSIATLFSWAVSYVEVNILPVLNNHYNESEKVFNYINQVKAYINSEVKLKDIKPVLKDLRELAKATNDNPITQAALRTIATACAVVTTPTNALGFTFYALATKVYHECKEIGVTVHAERTSVNVAAIAVNAVDFASKSGYDTVIIDTAGRLQIDDTMVQELVRIRQAVHPDELLLVADAALGQEAVSVAEHFHNALSLTGFILTKLDGDARAGAALSIREVTKVPVKFAGSGEKLDNLEVFHPERMASRILGMGDVVSLVEKAAAQIDEEEAKALQKKLRKNQFDYNDFLSQLKQISKLGGIESILKFLPGGKQLSSAMAGVDPKHFKRMEAIILSMTAKERENPDLIDFPRRKRIAKGAGVPVEMVSNLVKQFDGMRKMMRGNTPFGRMLASGGNVPEAGIGSFFGGGPTQLSKKAQEHKKKVAKLAKKERAKQRKRKK